MTLDERRRRIQRAVNVRDDGKLGPVSLAAIEKALGIADKKPPKVVVIKGTEGLDPRSKKNIDTYPDANVRAKFSKFAVAAQDVAAEFGCEFKVISGYRSKEKQMELYRKYKAGKGGKAAYPGYSWHNYPHQEAIDGGIFKGGRYLDSQNPALASKVYKAIAKIAPDHGLLWGGAFGDYPHFANAKTHTPTAAERKAL